MAHDIKIIGIFLVKNEDRFLDPVISNTLAFCDKLIIAENRSVDDTRIIAEKWQKRSDKVVVQTIEHPAESHRLIRGYCDSRTWVFGVDGDELYDPFGLAVLREKLLAGRFDRYWAVYGNVLNCVAVDEEKRLATGYMAPPCRSMTKLYNFHAIYDWADCPHERLHGGNVRFRHGWNEGKKRQLHKELTWDESYFRCLHLCFMPRSQVDRVDKNGMVIRENIMEMKDHGLRRWLGMARSLMTGRAKYSDYKKEKYMRGPQVQVDCSVFLRNREL